jgi:hypothetical protein
LALRKLFPRPPLVLGPSEDPRLIARINESARLPRRNFAIRYFGDGQSMKRSSIRKNYLFGAFGGLGVVLLGAAVSPAFAFTDVNGNTCDFSQLGPGGPGGQSICPTSSPSAPSSPSSSPPSFANPKMGLFRGSPLPPYENFDDFGRGNLAGGGGFGGAPTFGSGQNQLGMTVVPDGGVNGVGFGAGGSSTRTSGVGVSDSAGLLAPGAVATGFRQNSGSGGIAGSYDASSLVGPNQKLLLDGAFNYTSSSLNYAGGAGSINSDAYDFKGSALYTNYQSYVALSASYGFGTNHEFFAGDLSSGNYRSDSYDVDARFGHVFVLFNSIATAAPLPRMSVKAPPRTADGGYAIGVDLSGHVGYANSVARGFTDSSGFVFGDETAQGGEGGLRAKFFAEVPRNGVTWLPYITGTVDWRFDYSHVAYFPTQVALAGGDAVNFSDATTFVGGQIGLDVKTANGWTVGANGFYSHSSDTEIAGGKVYVKVPFGPATVVARY